MDYQGLIPVVELIDVEIEIDETVDKLIKARSNRTNGPINHEQIAGRIFNNISEKIFDLNVVLAGGAVKYMLENPAGRDFNINDYDLFVIANNEEEALDTVKKLMAICHDYGAEREDTQVVIIINNNTITIRYDEIEVQIILIYYEKMVDVLNDFDFSACMFLFDGTTVYTNEEGNHYVNFNYTKVNLEKFRSNTPYRIHKYCHHTNFCFPNYYRYLDDDTYGKYVNQDVAQSKIFSPKSFYIHSKSALEKYPGLYNLCELHNGRKNYCIKLYYHINDTDTNEHETDGDEHENDRDEHETDGDEYRTDGDEHETDEHETDGDEHETDGDKYETDGDEHETDETNEDELCINLSVKLIWEDITKEIY